MMLLRDDNTTVKTAPIVTYILIILNILFFIAEMMNGEEFIMKWAFIPSRLATNPVHGSVTLLTSMFMHGGIMHLVGNMLYLWIFGDNVEDRLGKARYIIFYLLSGIAATFAQYLFNSGSDIPNLGASGAIAGILGAYILLFPHQRVDVLVGRSIVSMSALVVIGFWIILQLFSSVGSLASTDDAGGGVAYMAHVGGFVAGIALAGIFKATESSQLK